MLINCPRCGFSQPKDQYCAQCGVDMQAFKPKSVPVMTKIFQSTKTHVILLLLAAIFVGQYVIRSDEPQRWVQKITRAQGVAKTKSKFDDPSMRTSGVSEASSERNDDQRDQLGSMRNKELAVKANVEQPIQAGSLNPSAPTENSNAGVPNQGDSNTNEPTFRILYAEVPVSLLNRWVMESSNAGQYQNLQEYSAGIITDFKKKTDSSMRILKTAEKKLNPGQSDTNFSGTVGEESGQIIGIATNIEFRSHEGANLHGTIVVNRTQKQSRENFPAEFDLPKGAAFFMVGAIRSNSFPIERDQLNMPPFQIFKSPEFAAGKTAFVIILEPEYK